MRLSCFGKLPFYPDFIKINGTDFNAVDQWFQKGILLLMQKLGADWAQKFSGASQYNFIFQGDQTRNAIVGAFIPGEDKSGRRFPFSIFFETSKIPLKKLDESLQSMEEAFLKKTGEFFKHEWTGVGLETFNQMFHSWEGQAASSSLLLLDEKQPLNFIWEETLDGAHDSRKYLLVKNLEDTLTPLTRVAAP
ncbi:MAG: type VI secretion system-associated protein TagF, partial [Nitrospinota bacterium]